MTRHYPDLGSTGDWSCRVGNLSEQIRSTTQIWVMTILGDPGAVSRAVRKGATKVFNHERKSPWVPTLTGPFPTVKGMLAPNWGQKKCFALLCPIGEQFLPSSFREFVHDIYYLATVTRFVHQAFVTRNEGTTDESKNVSDAISKRAIHFALRKFCF